MNDPTLPLSGLSSVVDDGRKPLINDDTRAEALERAKAVARALFN
ncbi:hypothetical protein RFM41_31320 [Mesorhizobium sp. VK25A]|uniref:Uncharacterized protein n=3 Tax=Mesorhizobium TaxID=68287 RepID=A0ABU5AE01_9HYPH|nr:MULTISPECIES: hypothetical protein [unclassified Mesorhizobium]MDX8450676.1 hypothetical protein [Mesorhizobium sp. VK3C]MDX8470055.1 hypothetical protein [Mesorhizobium sp. VK23B]MDX8476394.1 hypothetical protein [Mesorhizobium sp. VK23A]MDX8495670.1 hypothetical protein [Mesorhizobium sp. VK22B]MDX8508944.1 hypothetical protein [Mesorhizobium sp. VK22E]